MRVTPTLAQAAEAVLRGALEPDVAMRPVDFQRDFAAKACPCKGFCTTLVASHPSLESLPQSLLGGLRMAK